MEAWLTSDGLTLRRAAAGDLDALVKLQFAAYARNREILGVEPLPLLVDYADVLASKETWLAHNGDNLSGVLILEPEPDSLLVWSIATDPTQQLHGLGKRLLAAAEVRAQQLGLSKMRLYTGTKLTHLVAWYGRHGYVVDAIVQMPDRSRTDMSKQL